MDREVQEKEAQVIEEPEMIEESEEIADGNEGDE